MAGRLKSFEKLSEAEAKLLGARGRDPPQAAGEELEEKKTWGGGVRLAPLLKREVSRWSCDFPSAKCAHQPA